MSEFNNENLFSKRLRAGKRRTYFFDVRSTKNQDYFVTLTESKKRFNADGYERHKIFLYKEDFNKFLAALTETIDYVKTELMPDFDFDSFNHDESSELKHTFNESPSSKPEAHAAAPEADITETARTASAESIAVEASKPETPQIETSTIENSAIETPKIETVQNESPEPPTENPTRNEEAQEW